MPETSSMFYLRLRESWYIIAIISIIIGAVIGISTYFARADSTHRQVEVNSEQIKVNKDRLQKVEHAQIKVEAHLEYLSDGMKTLLEKNK